MDIQSGTKNMPKRRITAMIDQADILRLEEIAQRQRVSLAWVIRDAVSGYLAEKSECDNGLHGAVSSVRCK
ncbi:ribbon-helix-helix protein, CopG family [Ruegeria atlantica]|uniref:ribbon-helix-helix protein, CopG family n=1 Tax=Ruegeria atlantica TaxID=81569 RepID=UPI00147E8F5D